MPVISTNTAANTAVRYLNVNSAQESSSLAKLSSGSKINKASDDAAGLAISTRISSDITTLQQAATNASQASSILQTADGGASNISDILARMKSLATQAASGTVTDFQPHLHRFGIQPADRADRQHRQRHALFQREPARRHQHQFRRQRLEDPGRHQRERHHHGRARVPDLDDARLWRRRRSRRRPTPSTAAAAIDTAINTVSSARADIGALESRFNFSSDSISTQIENLDAAKSAITDVDIASEQAKLSSAEVLVQAAVSAESAANQMPQYLLKLLRLTLPVDLTADRPKPGRRPFPEHAHDIGEQHHDRDYSTSTSIANAATVTTTGNTNSTSINWDTLIEVRGRRQDRAGDQHRNQDHRQRGQDRRLWRTAGSARHPGRRHRSAQQLDHQFAVGQRLRHPRRHHQLHR